MSKRRRAAVKAIASLPRRAARLLRDSKSAADAADLEYVDPGELAIQRCKRGRGFYYRRASGELVRDERTLARIRKLAIPPAWTRVFIASSAGAHLQATGYDARGRKQYRYHEDWRRIRDVAKFDDCLLFVRALPRLRQRVARDLRQPRLSKDKVVAVVLSLMQRTLVRVGNERYAQENGSYGLTTLRDQHARISGEKIQLRFRGKGGKLITAELRDRRLAAAVKRCQAIPGQVLFQYYDADGERHRITSTDVNNYLQRTMGHPFTAKEFRTWNATVLAAEHLAGCAPCASASAGKRTLLETARAVAAELGNTAAICRKSYIHPHIFECYLRGELHHQLQLFAHGRRKPPNGLSTREAAVCALLESLADAQLQLERSA